MKNPFPSIGRFFVKVGKLALKAVQEAYEYAEKFGFDDELIAAALKYIRMAEATFADNTERREFVVSSLKQLFPQVPESVIRFALETAFQLFVKEVESHLPV